MNKLHFIYWAIILVLLNVFTVTFFYAGNEDLVSHVSFAGVISSIILALVAIIYTFYNNASNISTVNKLVDSAEKIESVTKKIDSSTDKLVEVSSYLNDIRDVVIRSQEGIVNIIMLLSQQQQEYQAQEKTFLLNYDESINIGKALLLNPMVMSDKFLCYLLKIYQQNKGLNIYDFLALPQIKDLWKVLRRDLNFQEGIYTFFLMLLIHLGLITLNLKNNLYYITIADEFAGYIQEYITQNPEKFEGIS